MRHLRQLGSLALLLLALAFTLPAPANAGVIPLSAEISIGREAAQYVEAVYPISSDPGLQARVERIGRRVAGVCGRPDLPFEFHVIEASEINAFALPGGFVYVFRGLLQGVPNDDALAFILGHEIAHAVQRHALGQFEKAQVVRVVTLPLAGVLGHFGRDVANVIIGKHFSREDETEADRLGLRYAVHAGFSPDSGVKAMDTLIKLGENRAHPELLMDHPDTARRKRAVMALGEQWAKNPPPRPSTPTVSLPAPAWDAPPVLPAHTPLYPLAVGSQWTYRLAATGGGATRATVRVLEQRPGDTPGIFRLETAYEGSLTRHSWVAASPEAIFTHPLGESARGRWQAEWRLQPGEEYSVEGTERIVVPAGAFECTRVRRRSADGTLLAEGWFAAGVGLVRATWPPQGVTQELLAFRLTVR